MIIFSGHDSCPSKLAAFLQSNIAHFQGWECSCCTKGETLKFDRTIHELSNLLCSYSLLGYHCTKLIPEEIEQIRSFGMTLQDKSSLNQRIDNLYSQNLVGIQLAQELKFKNQSGDTNRACMLWFCFFKPHIAGESGINRFFRSWGGEALYNSHETGLSTSKAIRAIGTPCIIRATVPVAGLRMLDSLSMNIVREYLLEGGHKIDNSTEFESYSKIDIEAENILEIIEFPSPKFDHLTDCQNWNEPL